MANNEIPKQLDKLLSLAEDMADGCAEYEVAIGIKQNLESVMRAAITAVRAAELDYQGRLTDKKTKSTAVQVADSNGKTTIENAKRVFGALFGNAYSVEWGEGGWPDNSTGIPGSQAERMNLLASLRDYFIAHPASENPGLQVTAPECDGRFEAISDARDELALAATACGTKKAVRDTTVLGLRKRARGLIDELTTLLDDEDPRWLAFGLSRPSDPSTPEIPANLVLTSGAGGMVLADWGDALRADRYRVYRQIVGVDADFVVVDTVNDSDASLNGFTTGQTVRVRVTAVNDAGESLPSEVKEIAIP